MLLALAAQKPKEITKVLQKIVLFLTGIAGLFVAVPVFAQGAAHAAATSGTSMGAIGAGVGMGIAAGLCGIGQGRAAGSACEGVARNPGARPAIFTFMILGLIFIESLALYTFVIIIIKVR
ncbi:MAG: ATP synthase F0 subunit C [Terriglobia bacterium]